LLRKAPAARVVSLSSGLARLGRINFDDLQCERHYRPTASYAQSKLASLLFARELHMRSQHHGWGILSMAAHPGITHTNLQSAGPRMGRNPTRDPLSIRLSKLLPLWQEIPQGALPTLYAATSPEAKGGGYYGPDGPFELRGMPAPAKVPPRAANEQTAVRLWQVSEQLTKVHFE
jgi:NAD(P)-dependent dehydrogenase (short-subunit alcohol dehydrogenase family)